jgi:hypothetical protein
MNFDRKAQIDKVLLDIRELHQQLVSKDIGSLKSLEIQFVGDDKPTTIKYNSR